MPTMFGGSRRGSSRPGDDGLVQDDATDLSGLAGDLLSSTYAVQRGESSRQDSRPRSRAQMYGLHGPRLPSWGSSSRMEERSRMLEDERSAIVREMEMAQHQMEGIEHSQRPTHNRSTSSMMEDNHRFLRESAGVGEAVTRDIHGLSVPTEHVDERMGGHGDGDMMQ